MNDVNNPQNGGASNGNGGGGSGSSTASQAANKMPLLEFSQQGDLKVLSGLINQLTDILEDNRVATDELCAMADELNINTDGGEDEARTVGVDIENDDDEVQTLDGTEDGDLDMENESLRKQCQAAHQKLKANYDFLQVCMWAHERCMKQLREFVNGKTLDTLELHRGYIAQIEQEQNKFMDLVQKRFVLENEIYKLSRSLGIVVRMASDYDDRDVTASMDYHHGMSSILREYRNRAKS